MNEVNDSHGLRLTGHNSQGTALPSKGVRVAVIDGLKGRQLSVSVVTPNGAQIRHVAGGHRGPAEGHSWTSSAAYSNLRELKVPHLKATKHLMAKTQDPVTSTVLSKLQPTEEGTDNSAYARHAETLQRGT